MTANEDKIADLQRQIDVLKSAQPAPPLDAEELRKLAAEHANEMHQLREQSANSFRFRPDIQRRMNEACDAATGHDLARHGVVQGPSTDGTDGQLYHSSSRPGIIGSGWRNVPEFGADGQHPTPGISHVDRVAEGFAQQERAELAQKLGVKR
jgi:hypothetical protein